MSKKNKWFQNQHQPGAQPVAQPIGPDAPTIDDGEDTPEPETVDGITPGQIWDDVIVPDRSVNVLSLTPGAKLGALMVDGPCDDGTGHWVASFVGESMTKIRVDAEMLKSGRLRE